VHWLEAIYNRRRRHSAIDISALIDHEERYWDRRAAAQRRCLPGRGKTVVRRRVLRRLRRRYQEQKPPLV